MLDALRCGEVADLAYDQSRLTRQPIEWEQLLLEELDAIDLDLAGLAGRWGRGEISRLPDCAETETSRTRDNGRAAPTRAGSERSRP